jgi:hypothetical protein
MKQLTDEQIARYIKLAQRKTCQEISEADGEEYFNPADYGNYDDVYGAGYDDGRINTAREILDMFEIKY